MACIAAIARDFKGNKRGNKRCQGNKRAIKGVRNQITLLGQKRFLDKNGS